MPPFTGETAQIALAIVLCFWVLAVFSPLRWVIRRVTWSRFLPRDLEMRDAVLATRARVAFVGGQRLLAHKLCARHRMGKWIYNGLVRDMTPEKAQTDVELRRVKSDELRQRAIEALNNNNKAEYQRLWLEAHRVSIARDVVEEAIIEKHQEKDPAAALERAQAPSLEDVQRAAAAK